MSVIDSPPGAARAAARAGHGLAWITLAINKLIQGVLTLLLVSVLVFGATQVLPGNAAAVLLGQSATPDRVAALSKQLGLSDPIIEQYWRWLSGILRGDLGTSLASHGSVAQLIGGPVGNSFVLAGMAVVLIVPISLILGVTAARFKDSWFDKGFLGTSMIANALPDFIIGTILVFLFGTTVFHLFPPVAIIPLGEHPWDFPAKLVMPVATLAILGIMYLSRLVRVSVIDVLASEYVEMAQLKGLSPRRILFVHALPNALAPAIPAASIVAALTVGSAVVVEYLFNYPGMGVLLLQSIGARDLPTIQAIVMIIAAVYFVFNFIADLINFEKA